MFSSTRFRSPLNPKILTLPWICNCISHGITPCPIFHSVNPCNFESWSTLSWGNPFANTCIFFPRYTFGLNLRINNFGCFSKTGIGLQPSLEASNVNCVRFGENSTVSGNFCMCPFMSNLQRWRQKLMARDGMLDSFDALRYKDLRLGSLVMEFENTAPSTSHLPSNFNFPRQVNFLELFSIHWLKVMPDRIWWFCNVSICSETSSSYPSM